MLDFLKKFEQIIIGAMIVLMVIVITVSTIDLGIIIIKEILSPPVFLLQVDELLNVFGFFLLVLIGVELLGTIQSYLMEHVIHVEVVVEVALIAIARKVIILEVKDVPSISLIGIAAIILALTGAYFAIKNSQKPMKIAGKTENSPDTQK